MPNLMPDPSRKAPVLTADEAAALTTLMPALTRLARILSTSPEQAEDMAQEALLQVWSRLKRGGTIDDLRPYLMTTLRNASTRAHTPHHARTVALTDQNTPSENSAIWDRLAMMDVTIAISRLPDDQAALLRPYALHGASYADLALTFDLPIGTVMSRIARARAQLRADLDLPKSRAVDALLDKTGC
ncbi:MAG: sigma-70 family RNA polymerase sigma factor [Rhodobacterales bacterium]|nr:sigma-70 family RNA polymerase sigma factor [Rhodobacterales bacterium]